MSVSVRAAGPGDLDRVAELTAAAYLADGLLGEQDDYLAELRDAQARAARSTVLVAVDDDEVVGSITVAVAGSPDAEVAEPGEVELRMLAVDPQVRGRGVGELLLRTAVERAVAGGARGVVLSTMPTMAAARRMYDRLGWVRVPSRDWQVAGHDLLVYATLGR